MQIRKTRHALVVLLSILLLISNGCKSDPNETFIQGEWFSLDEHLGGIPGEKDQEDSIFFDRGVYSESGCCYIEYQEKGDYRIIESTDNELTLELSNRDGHIGGILVDRDATVQIKILIDRDADTIRVNRTTYERVEP